MNKFAKQLLPFCSLIFIVSLWACLEPENFLSFQNFSNVLRRSSVNGIMAAGMTFIEDVDQAAFASLADSAMHKLMDGEYSYLKPLYEKIKAVK